MRQIHNVHLGLGRTVCEPLDFGGIIGACYWQSELKFDNAESDSRVEETSFIYDVLSYMGQIGGRYNNFTVRIYRTDVSNSLNGRYFSPDGVRDGVKPPGKEPIDSERPPVVDDGRPIDDDRQQEPPTKHPPNAEKPPDQSSCDGNIGRRIWREDGWLFFFTTVLFLAFALALSFKGPTPATQTKG
jgi:hypothetical protein